MAAALQGEDAGIVVAFARRNAHFVRTVAAPSTRTESLRSLAWHRLQILALCLDIVLTHICRWVGGSGSTVEALLRIHAHLGCTCRAINADPDHFRGLVHLIESSLCPLDDWSLPVGTLVPINWFLS